MINTRYIFLIALLAVSPVHAAVTTGTDEQAQLPYWQWTDDVVSVRFVQRLPDQTRAFFAGRGFRKDDVRRIAEHCVFQTVFKNIAPTDSHQTLEYNLDKWSVLKDGKQVSLKLREAWRPVWEQRQVQPAQRIAFEWALLPTRQRYLPADYNWGMIILPIQHGSKFNLVMYWTVNGKPLTTTIKDMQCAEDVYIAPQVNN